MSGRIITVHISDNIYSNFHILVSFVLHCEYWKQILRMKRFCQSLFLFPALCAQIHFTKIWTRELLCETQIPSIPRNKIHEYWMFQSIGVCDVTALSSTKNLESVIRSCKYDSTFLGTVRIQYFCAIFKIWGKYICFFQNFFELGSPVI